MKLFATLTDSMAVDPQTKRRGRILVTLCLGVIVTLLSVGTVLTLLQPSPGRFLNLGIALLVFATAAALGRKGYVATGTYILIIISSMGATSGVFLNATSPFNLFYLLVSILLASVLLPPRQIWIVLGLCLIGLALIIATVSPEIRTAINLNLAVAHLAVLLIVSAFISFIGARSLSAALEAAERLRRQAETASQELSMANAMLESRVEERTAALKRVADEQRAVMAQLEASLQVQQQLHQAVLELAVPVIPVSDEALVVPLSGVIDSERARQFIHSVLQSLEQSRARFLIIDLTGVAVIDTYAAVVLLQVAQAARLIGAETILAGIRPEVAQTLVGLEIDLSDLRTVATLQSALAFIMSGGRAVHANYDRSAPH